VQKTVITVTIVILKKTTCKATGPRVTILKVR